MLNRFCSLFLSRCRNDSEVFHRKTACQNEPPNIFTGCPSCVGTICWKSKNYPSASGRISEICRHETQTFPTKLSSYGIWRSLESRHGCLSTSRITENKEFLSMWPILRFLFVQIRTELFELVRFGNFLQNQRIIYFISRHATISYCRSFII